MKKSLLALAVLGAFTGLASAQSSVTIYGLVDANVGKDIGSDDKRVGQGAQSRLGFRGVEDLGNGLKATFNFQHRFDSGTGAGQGTPGASGTTAASTSPFWQAEANVGLAGNFGNVRIGRQYTEAFYQQISADPWGYDTVANLKAIITGGIAADRANNSISYWITQSGFTFGAQIAEANDNGGATSNQSTPGLTGQKRPSSFRLQYAAGPIAAGISYDNPQRNDDNWTLINGSYNLGVAKVGAFYGDGKNNAAIKRKSYGVTVTAPFGPGEARAGVGQLKGANALGGSEVTQRQQVSLGYHYSLSKRTTIYGDVASAKTDNASISTAAGNNGKASDSAYDFGIKHVF
jgi:predicted porin